MEPPLHAIVNKCLAAAGGGDGVQGKATGSRRALWICWHLQWRLFLLSCFVQSHAGKVLFLGVLLLSLCAVGLKTATLETSVKRLWVEGM